MADKQSARGILKKEGMANQPTTPRKKVVFKVPNTPPLYHGAFVSYPEYVIPRNKAEQSEPAPSAVKSRPPKKAFLNKQMSGRGYKLAQMVMDDQAKAKNAKARAIVKAIVQPKKPKKAFANKCMSGRGYQFAQMVLADQAKAKKAKAEAEAAAEKEHDNGDMLIKLCEEGDKLLKEIQLAEEKSEAAMKKKEKMLQEKVARELADKKRNQNIPYRLRPRPIKKA